MQRIQPFVLIASALGLSAISAAPLLAQINTGEPQILSTNQTITPLAPKGARFEPLNPGLASDPSYTVGQAVSTVISPDGKTLLILTSGYNFNYISTGANAGQTDTASSNEFIFVFDISGTVPIQKQAIAVPAAYNGIVFDPSGTEFYVSGGDSDNVHFYKLTAGIWAESGQPFNLGHILGANAATGSSGGLGIATPPEAAGLAISEDGTRLLIADYENDAVSLLVKTDGVWTKGAELDLRPGKAQFFTQSGTPGGEYPFWVVAKGNDAAYVSSVRDREVDLVTELGVIDRIKLPGQPNKMILNKAQTLLFVAQDNSDSVAVIDTNTQQVIAEIPVTAPAAVYANPNGYKGANPNSLALSPDEKTLYVTNGGENAVAVISMNNLGTPVVTGLIPTGFYPNSVSVSADGKTLYVVNGKSANGPNPQYSATEIAATANAANESNQYDFQLTKAGFQTVPVPTAAELSTDTAKVIANDHFGRTLNANQQATMAFLHRNIKHIIYIIKENRTYDQVLGDLPVGNGDPSITQFPEANTPNFHNIALNFVDFDNFYDVSEVSGDGWPWSTSARTTDVIEKEIPVNYGGRGIDNDSEGTNRNLNVGIPTTTARYAADPLTGTDPDLLPGNANVAAPDAAGDSDDDTGQGQGYIWNGALKAGLTVRDYGFFLDLVRYNLTAAPSLNIPEDPNAFADKLQVAFSTNTVLSQYTDPYYRGFDNSFPDYFRFTEWQREFNQYEAAGNLPNLTLLRLMHDHFGNFGTALDGVNTPPLQIADNDYAVGSVIQAVANSKDANDTLIFVIEDDAQDGGDHVDAHRSTAFIVGSYVKQGVVDSTRYNTVDMLVTMEQILGIAPLNLNDANGVPMANAFDTKPAKWTYTAVPSALLAQTSLPIPASAFSASAQAALKQLNLPSHSPAWWTARSKGMDFSVEDHLDSNKFNHLVWLGTMGNKPYPTARSGADLSRNRAEFLRNFHAAQQGGQVSKESKESREKGETSKPAVAINGSR